MRERFARTVVWTTGRNEPLVNEFSGDLEVYRSVLPNDGSVVQVVSGKRCRVTRCSEGGYTALSASSDPDRIKSRSIMDHELRIALSAAPAIDAASLRAEQRSRRLIHNLKSLTAKTSQEIFYLVKQDVMFNAPQDSVAYISQEISRHPEDAAKAVIEILKHQSAQRAEFSAFEKLSGKVGAISRDAHDVHRVLMNVFYLFFGEFVDKKVRAYVEPTKVQASFDYDSIHACIYYIVENAAKYVSKNSALNVTTSVDKDGLVDIRFDMESLLVPLDEQDLIFSEGFSGSAAKRLGLAGSGIGLFLARQLAQLNGGSLNFLAGKATRNADYARNAFILTLTP